MSKMVLSSTTSLGPHTRRFFLDLRCLFGAPKLTQPGAQELKTPEEDLEESFGHFREERVAGCQPPRACSCVFG